MIVQIAKDHGREDACNCLKGLRRLRQTAPRNLYQKSSPEPNTRPCSKSPRLLVSQSSAVDVFGADRGQERRRGRRDEVA